VSKYQVINIGNREYLAGPGNVVGLAIMQQLQILRAGVAAIDRQRLIEIATLIQQNQKDSIQPATPAEEYAAEMKFEELVLVIQGAFPTQKYLESTLISLAKVSKSDYEL
jgi:hypothetical protein